jgi:3-oxoacyl-[acyl-carrier protein] reductase
MEPSCLKNKNCLITGATGGLGTALSIEFAKNNCNLFLTSRNNHNLKILKSQLQTQNKTITVKTFSADLSNLSEINNLIKEIRKSYTTIDILINCAGILPLKFIQDSTVEDFDECFNINVRAPIILIKEFSKDMTDQRWGRIVNIASSAAYNGLEKTIIYRATKHALLGFSKAVHKELRDYNVRTFCISPGPIKTKMGEILENENYQTFINPSDIADFITNLISYDTEMFSEEIRLGRIIGEK